MFIISTNLDRVAKISSIGALPWTALMPTVPNRVHLVFNSKDSAQRLHDALVAARVVVFRSWLD